VTFLTCTFVYLGISSCFSSVIVLTDLVPTLSILLDQLVMVKDRECISQKTGQMSPTWQRTAPEMRQDVKSQ